eukprot:592038-Amphidinium_carterae.3
MTCKSRRCASRYSLPGETQRRVNSHGSHSDLQSTPKSPTAIAPSRYRIGGVSPSDIHTAQSGENKSSIETYALHEKLSQTVFSQKHYTTHGYLRTYQTKHNKVATS